MIYLIEYFAQRMGYLSIIQVLYRLQLDQQGL